MVGGGLLLAAACDLRIASVGTSCALPEVDLGIPLLWGGVPLLCDTLGSTLSKEMVLTGRRVGDEELLDRGFWNQVCAEEDRQAEVTLLAAELAAKPVGPLLASKKQFQRAQQSRFEGLRAFDSRIGMDVVQDPAFVTDVLRYLQRMRSGKPSSD